MLIQVHLDYHLKLGSNFKICSLLKLICKVMLMQDQPDCIFFLFQDLERPAFGVEYISLRGCKIHSLKGEQYMATRHWSCKPVSIMTIIACCALKTTRAAYVFLFKKNKNKNWSTANSRSYNYHVCYLNICQKVSTTCTQIQYFFRVEGLSLTFYNLDSS